MPTPLQRGTHNRSLRYPYVLSMPVPQVMGSVTTLIGANTDAPSRPPGPSPEQGKRILTQERCKFLKAGRRPHGRGRRAYRDAFTAYLLSRTYIAHSTAVTLVCVYPAHQRNLPACASPNKPPLSNAERGRVFATAQAGREWKPHCRRQRSRRRADRSRAHGKRSLASPVASGSELSHHLVNGRGETCLEKRRVHTVLLPCRDPSATVQRLR